MNLSCDVMFYSWQDSVDAERARLTNSPPPPISSHKPAQKTLLEDFRRGLEQMVGVDSTTTERTAKKDRATAGGAALNEAGEGTDGQKPAA